MQSSIMIALQVFGIGFFISLFIAVIIKATLYGIRLLSKEEVKK